MSDCRCQYCGCSTDAAELSRMRTALEEIRARKPYPHRVTDAIGVACSGGWDAAYNQCAAIAERALTAGSGNE